MCIGQVSAYPTHGIRKSLFRKPQPETHKGPHYSGRVVVARTRVVRGQPHSGNDEGSPSQVLAQETLFSARVKDARKALLVSVKA